MSQADKKIIQYINKDNGQVHCFLGEEESAKYSYSDRRWDKVIRETTWIEEEIKELTNEIKENSYLKVTYISNKVKNETIYWTNKTKLTSNFSEWELPDYVRVQDIFKLEIVVANEKELFRYYFHSNFYKAIKSAKEIEDETSENEDNEFEKIMERYMEATKYKISFEQLSDSLQELFDGEQNIQERTSNISFIHPLFNFSQFQAIEKSLTKTTTIIEGPPGTGKTTTLINIIITAFLEGKTVLIASKNNGAVDNVLESLEKYNFDKFWFRFGSGRVIDQELEKTALISLKNKKQKNHIYKSKNIYQELKDLIDTNENQKEIKESFQQWESLRIYFYKEILKKNINVNFAYNKELPRLKFKTNIFNYIFWFMLNKKSKKFIHELNNIINSLYDKDIQEITRENFEECVVMLKKDIFLLNQYKKIEKNATNAKNSIKDINFQEEWDKIKNNESYYKSVYQDINNHIEKTYELRKKVLNNIKTKGFDGSQGIKKGCMSPEFLSDFLKAFPIHFVTNLSIYKLPNIKYDYVIMDEAGQCDIQSTIGLLQKGRHNILCGDVKQLEPIYKMSKQEDDKLAESFNIDKFFRANDNSMMNIYSSFLSKERIAFLDEHYRCPPDIVKFSNAMFYNDELVIKTKNQPDEDSISLINIEGDVEKKQWINHDEIEAIIKDIQTCGIDLKDVAIISPFRAQVNAMNKRPELEGVAIDTVFKFQGREFNRIYFSSVIGSRMSKGGIDYLNKPSILNVALTRAKKNFILVSNTKEIQKQIPNSLVGKLQSYILEKKYKMERNDKESVDRIWVDNIVDNDSLKKIQISNLFTKLKKICEKNSFKLAVNTRYADVFNIDKESEYFFKGVDYALYDDSGSIKLAIDDNCVIYVDNKEEILFSDLNLSKNIIHLKIRKILTKSENSFMSILENVLSDHEMIFPSVKLSTVIDLEKQINLSGWMKKSAEAMHFDFVVYKKMGSELIPIKVIELDDITHTQKSSKIRDKRKDWFASKAKIKIKRFISYKY